MIAKQQFGKPHMHKSKIVNNSKKILPTFLLLLGTTALSGLPNVAMADEEMIIIADTNGDGTIDGTAGEWATGNSYTDAISSDGSFIAGPANDGTADRAFRWDATNGMVNIADTDGDGVVGTPGSGEWATSFSTASAM